MEIDIVVLWVDGNDPAWQQDFMQYANLSPGDKRVSRFRDWNILKYWFRGIEQFAPWVNKVHFVTYGHYPSWLNLNCPKLHFVKHSDFIPQEYLPTFNANAIELNIHRIKGLADHFIYFNDDIYLIAPTPVTRFFKNGRVADFFVLNALSGEGIGHIILNDIQTINIHFSKQKVLKQHLFKWLNYVYGKDLFRTFALLPWPRFTGFVDPHFPSGFLKSTFEKVWEIEYELLDKTCRCKFRNETNVNQYLMRYWQLMEGNFTPINVFKDSVFVGMKDRTAISDIQKVFESKKKNILVLNDDCIADFALIKEQLITLFETRLPCKSQFEK